MSRILLFVLVGAALGFVLDVLARFDGTGRPRLLLIGLRLAVFMVALGWLVQRLGAWAGLVALAASVLTRGALARRRTA